MKIQNRHYRSRLILLPWIAMCWTAGLTVQADSGPLTGLAIIVLAADDVSGSGSLEEFLLDRLGSNGVYPIADSQRVRATLSVTGLDRRDSFDRSQLVTVGQMVGCRWVVWVKVAHRGLEFRKGFSIPHLFIRRKAVSHMLIDARIVDVQTTELVASYRWRLDESGAGSYQVAEDVLEDPLYNNSAGQLYQDGRHLEWEADRDISVWFKALIPQVSNLPAVRGEEKPPGTGPSVVDKDTI